ncbi:MAG: Gfo/Idh/MocA family protein [Planctomycetaceae bacterium]
MTPRLRDSMTSPLRFLIIGCGRMGRVHAERLHADGRGRVVGVCDNHSTAAERLRADLAPDAVVFADAEALLDGAAADAAIICTPTTAHFDQVRACRARGLHVLCEKPLADTRARIVQLIEGAGACRPGAGPTRPGSAVPLLSVGYQRRYWATYRTLRREVLSGRWGAVRAVTSHNVENWQQTIAGTWRDDQAVNWGGFLGDAGSHKLDAVFYVTGLEPIDALARCDRCGSRVEITATVAARLARDVPLAMDLIGHAQYLGEDLHIHCERADLMVRDRRVWIARDGRIEELTDLEPDSNPTVGFLDLLTDQAENIAPPECALPVFDFTRAILESCASGRIVRVG